LLFNSYVFILAFLPICLVVAGLLAKLPSRLPYLWWLVIASVVFYSWQDIRLTTLFLTSIAFNYLVAGQLIAVGHRHRFALLTLGVVANLAFIGYFKYLCFFVATTNSLLATHWDVGKIALPLGISFYTFQQIAYLVDAYRGEVKQHNLVNYCLFVAFFPQLIAGPIVHHRDVLSQFSSPKGFRLNSADIGIGMTMFTIGLFKKVVLADGIAPFATLVFSLARDESEMNRLVAWIGALSYTLQLYFDFSGYSDMALGLGRMFSIRLPINFDSPYKAVSIVDFWRRWHITLSDFLRDYLYIPLGGNRQGAARRYVNLMITMLLGGLWHGAGWTFVIWGGLHGLFLIINHVWNSIFQSGFSAKDAPQWRIWFGRVTTFLAVTCAWVFFRAENTHAALHMLSKMFGFAGQSVETSAALWNKLRDAPGFIIAFMAIVWLLPNTQQLMSRVRPALRYRYRPDLSTWEGRIARWLQWRPASIVAMWYAGMFVVAICSFSRVSEFIYFNF
jgi:D-alanyl-lipoteichoic acid acyltransferase DltB (MBOAT superfamily)